MNLQAVPKPAEDPHMDKAELSKMLEAKVLGKLQAGYQITTYAMDAASRDRLKRGMKP